MGEDVKVTDAIFNLLKLRIDAVTGINVWKGTGKPKRETGEKYPRKSAIPESVSCHNDSDSVSNSKSDKSLPSGDENGDEK